jgi:hypothetical protein
MKKLLVVLAFGLLTQSIWGQGTIQFQNTTVSSAFFTNSPSGTGKVTITPATMAYGLFFSNASQGGASNNLTFATAVGNSTSFYGVIQGNSVLTLPGTNPGDQVWLMMLAWDGALGFNGHTNYIGPYGSGPAGGMNGQWNGAGRYFLQTRTILVTMGAIGGPGTVMFQSSGDVDHLGGTDLYIEVPEPAAFTMVIFGSAMIYYFRRRRR